MPSESPILYEVNTRVWLGELSSSLGGRITLGSVPDRELKRWHSTGFTHVWLMGIWETGPETRKLARTNEHLRSRCLEAGLDPSRDIGASPYAIRGYRVAPEIGTAKELVEFRDRLRNLGLGLILDFIPNHVGMDHPWLAEHPERFIRSLAEREGCFRWVANGEPVWIAHGRDPYFPAWTDTAQLDYRVPGLQEAMISELEALTNYCDGVRCDMAMLVLQSVFERTWADWSPPTERCQTEFWRDAVQSVRRIAPNFLFIAEVYWGLEPELRSLGFDYTYDKVLYDHLLAGDNLRVREHLFARSAHALASSVSFLENHDERRIASAVSIERHRTAMALLLSLPGMVLLHDGQLTGRKLQIPVQFLRRPEEKVDVEVMRTYEELFTLMKQTRIRKGQFRFLQAKQPIDGEGIEDLVLAEWRDEVGFELVAINFGTDECTFRIGPYGSSLRVRVPSGHPSLVFSTDTSGFLSAGVPAQDFAIFSLDQP